MIRMKKCRKCGKVYPVNLSHCPECYAKNVEYIIAIIMGILVFVVVFASLFIILLTDYGILDDNPNELTRDTYADVIASDGTISLDEFNRIETGMTYDEVCKIIGGEGVLTSSSDFGIDDEYKTELYEWTGDGSIGANANIMFQNGKVTSKAQFGLK